MEHSPIEAAGIAPAAFTVEGKQLQLAVNYLAKRILERRNTIPILSHIMVTAAPGLVTLAGTDTEIFARVTLPADVETPGAFCLDGYALADVLAKAVKGKAPDTPIGFEDGEARCTVKAGRSRFGVKRLPVDNFPPFDNLATDESAFEMDGPQFVADLAALKACTSSDENRYYLCGYALQVRPMGGADRLVMVATDGGNMGVASRPLPPGVEELEDSILPTKAGAALQAAAKLEALEGMRAQFDGKAWRFAFGRFELRAKNIDGTFPDWQRESIWADALAPADAPALFPELLPGTPAAALEKIRKGAPGVVWEAARKGVLGRVPGDSGLVFGAMSFADEMASGRKGFVYEWTGRGEAESYLLALAETRGTPLPGAIEAAAAAINEEWGEPSLAAMNREAPHCSADAQPARLVTIGTRVVGLTIAGTVRNYAWREDVQDWEALAMRRVDHPDTTEALEGSYSVLMPADGPGELKPASWVDDEAGARYPVAFSEHAIHFTKEQLRALIGESVFETIELTPGRYVCRWLFEQGDSRLLLVAKDGRFKGDGPRQYVTRAEAEALLAGEEITPEPAECAELEAPAVEMEITPPAVEMEAASAFAPTIEGEEPEASAAAVPCETIEPVEAAQEPLPEPDGPTELEEPESTPAAALDGQPADLRETVTALLQRVAALEAAAAKPEDETRSAPPAVEAAPDSEKPQWQQDVDALISPTPAAEIAELRAKLEWWQHAADVRADNARRFEARTNELERDLRVERHKARERRLAAVRRYLAARRARQEHREAIAYWEGAYAEAKAEHWQAVSDAGRHAAKRRANALFARKRTRELVAAVNLMHDQADGLRSRLASETKARESLEFDRVELEERLAVAELEAKEPRAVYGAEIDRLTARCVWLENREIERASNGRIKLNLQGLEPAGSINITALAG